MLGYLPTEVYDETTPSGLYAMCMDAEAKLEKMDIGELLASSAWFLLFEIPLFKSYPPGDCDPPNERRYHGYPYSFSIDGPDAKVSEPDWRYRQLLRLLKQFGDAELRWLLVARWLHEEDVCEPDEFLPPTILRHLFKRYLAQTAKFSTTDCRIWCLIKIWSRYFSPLQDAARKIPKTDRHRTESLAKLGYDSDAIHWVLVTRSLVRAITSWLQGRGKGDARSLENAYSRGESYLRNKET